MIRILLEKLFYILLFFALFMPNHSSLLLFGYTIRDVLLVILVAINIFLSSKLAKTKLTNISTILVIYCFINELIIKGLIYPNVTSSLFYSFRMGLPLFTVLSFFIFGYNLNQVKTWKTINLAVIFSGVISIVSTVYGISLNNDELLSIESTGRIFNDNASIGLIYIYILLFHKNNLINAGLINKVACYVGIVIMILAFNRTLLFCASLLLLMFVFKKRNKSISLILKSLAAFLFFLIFFVIVYNNFPTIAEQVDHRILYIFDNNIESNDRLFENNRDVIYFGVLDAIDNGFWLFGMPFSLPIFYNIYSSTYVNFTDTSLVNILLRFGIFALILFLIIYNRMIKIIAQKDRFLFYIFILLSFNVDIFFRHITILYIFIFWLFLAKNNKKTF